MAKQQKYFVKTERQTAESTVNPVLLAAATITVVCSQNEDENAKVGVRL